MLHWNLLIYQRRNPFHQAQVYCNISKRQATNKVQFLMYYKMYIDFISNTFVVHQFKAIRIIQEREREKNANDFFM